MLMHPVIYLEYHNNIEFYFGFLYLFIFLLLMINNINIWQWRSNSEKSFVDALCTL